MTSPDGRTPPRFPRAVPALAAPSRSQVAVAAVLAALAVAAVANARAARTAERENRPLGKILEVDGLRLHYLERGEGPPLVLLHGNGSMVEDFVSSGLVDAAARTHRVVAVDRPGFGHSDRPAGLWNAAAQADVVAAALRRLGVSGATVLGHSWGCQVAVALARRHPDLVSGLVLASGYYYPTARLDVIGPSLLAVPLLGDALRHTVAPLLARAQWPLALRALFGPAPVPARFAGFPQAMTFRPSQIRASAQDSALMIPDAIAAAGYGDLTLPVAIVAGAEDRIVDIEAQSARLQGEIPHATLDRVEGAGHMVHQTALPRVLAAIARVSGGGRRPGVPLAA